MDYQNALSELKKIHHQKDVDVKNVPGRTEEGWLSDETRQEFQAMFEHGAPFLNVDPNSPKPPVQVMRDAMGTAKHHSIATHPLEIDNTVIAGTAVRMYRRADCSEKDLPTVIYLHGGAFYGGSALAVEDIARAFADQGEYQVLNLEYPLAPEHPFPYAVLACYNVLSSLHERARQFRIKESQFYLAGDSAGGNLSAAVAYLDRVVFQTNWVKKIVLYYPDLDHDMNDRKKYSDELINELTFKEMKTEITQLIDFMNNDPMAGDYYCGAHDRKQALLSPLLADHLKLMPPTELIVGEFDPLRGQGEAFVKKLRSLGVETRYLRYNGMSHAFLDHLGYDPQAEDAIHEGIRFLKEKDI